MGMRRRCDITLANDQKWYLTLGDFEDAYDDYDCTIWGPFNTEEELERHRLRFPNPGGSTFDDSGTEEPPEGAIKPGQRAPLRPRYDHDEPGF